MVCTHLKELYQLCELNRISIGSSDLVRITCRQCNEAETCPSMLMDEYDAHITTVERPGGEPTVSESNQVSREPAGTGSETGRAE